MHTVSTNIYDTKALDYFRRGTKRAFKVYCSVGLWIVTGFNCKQEVMSSNLKKSDLGSCSDIGTYSSSSSEEERESKKKKKTKRKGARKQRQSRRQRQRVV